MSFSEYRVIYGVHLIDDLHNYFPRVLYSPTSFHSVTELLLYVQERTMNRFNLYSYGQSLVNPSPPVNETFRPAPPAAREAFTVEISEPPITMNPLVSPIRYTTSRLDSTLLPLLQQINRMNAGGGHGGAVPAGTSMFQDVVVTPTPAVIAAGSSLRTLEADSTENCAICQDAFRSGEEIRHLTACNHDFHRSCIDNWYRRSTLCPTCRHDIREPQRASPRLGPVPSPEATEDVQSGPSTPSVSTSGRRRRAANIQEATEVVAGSELLDILFNLNGGLNRFYNF